MVLWTAWLVGLQLSAARASLATASGESLAFDLGFWGIVLPVAVVAWAMVGLLVSLRRPSNAVGWLCLTFSLAVVVHTAAFEWSLHTFESAPGSLPAGTAAALISAVSGELMMPLPLTLIVLTFPFGRLAGRRSCALAVFASVATLVAIAGQAASQSVYAGEHSQAANPLAPLWLPALMPASLVQLGHAAGVVALALAITGLAIRTRRASGVERRQLSWFTATGGVSVMILAVAGVSALLHLPWLPVVALLLGPRYLGSGCRSRFGLPFHGTSFMRPIASSIERLSTSHSARASSRSTPPRSRSHQRPSRSASDRQPASWRPVSWWSSSRPSELAFSVRSTG